MIQTKTFTANNMPSDAEYNSIANFLFLHLEQFGDPKDHIQQAMDFALQKLKSPGGLLVSAWDEDNLVGAVVLNRTGMKDYIPQNILVYIATHNEYRGKGIGKMLMKETIDNAIGDIALHVEPDNPAKKLYEKLGFTNKYLEMRLKK